MGLLHYLHPKNLLFYSINSSLNAQFSPRFARRKVMQKQAAANALAMSVREV